MSDIDDYEERRASLSLEDRVKELQGINANLDSLLSSDSSDSNSSSTTSEEEQEEQNS